MNHNNYFSSPLADRVIPAAADGCAVLRPGEIRTARQLCGADFWDSLSKREQIQAGRIISEAVKAGHLPLIRGERAANNHQRYQRVSSASDP